MKTYRNSIIVLLISCGFAASAAAEDYDFEVGLTYGRGSSDSTFISTVNGVPTPSLGVATTSSDSDNINLTGAWYYSGLSDSIGPKSRAAFLSRASGVEVGYSRRDGSGSFDFTGGGVIPPVTGSTNTTANALSVDLRNVWRDSGWYALAGISTAELEASAINNGTAGSSELSTTAYSFGVGKYLGKATTLDLRVATLDAEGSDRTVFELTLSHVGSIGKNWQYGADVAYAKSDADGDGETYAMRGALYPSANFEFGLEFSHREVGVVGFNSDGIEAFAGWFVSDNVELAARYRQDNPDAPPGAEVDSSEFGVGVIVRF
jgi:hypothetical protein